MIRAGCCGFPIARARYFTELGAVEIKDTFEKLPRIATAENWRADAPKDFAFSIRAWRAITHADENDVSSRRRGATGYFRPTPEVGLAWDATRAFATALGARFVLFETPPAFYADADHLRDMYRFFKEIRRDKLTLVWQPRGRWNEDLAGRVCKDLELVPAFDPLERATKAPRARVNYFRLPGAPHADAALKALRSLCEGAPSYVFFMGREGFDEARRFARG